jgi:hypothetical protein
MVDGICSGAQAQATSLRGRQAQSIRTMVLGPAPLAAALR